MNENKLGKHKKQICIGILAHVDAGKTTLSEGMLYTSGTLRRQGRVDKGNAFLDHDMLERERGITIFSKQAVFENGSMQMTLLDTPGHVDFSAEMERTLQVLDYAILVIGGADGVQGHTRTLWKLLERYQIPVFLFVNKMDQAGTDKEALLAELEEKLSDACVDFDKEQSLEAFFEKIAVCEETVLETYLETGTIEEETIAGLIAERSVFPCYFGSALHLSGVAEFLQGLETWTKERRYPPEFGAKVYKIARDAQGNRLTYMKITGGRLCVKALLNGRTQGGEQWEEKADQIRIYSGAKYEAVREAQAGSVCAVTGLTHTYAGQGLGAEPSSELPVLEPVLTYRVRTEAAYDVHQTLEKLRQLEEEEPQLHVVWEENLNEIHAKLMGEVQIEILKRLMKDRYGIPVTFDSGNIVYKETIAAPVEGVGHFEPLRHYAEVHLLLEPLETGSGLVFDSVCSEDLLNRNWQRLILTHLEEKEHRGVLTGAPITDMKITLIAGRAHEKHTEGGDFRQATYRAVRQGLKRAESILLEPYYEFRLEIPVENVGRAMADVTRMSGTFAPPESEGSQAVLAGKAPVSKMRDYQREVVSYTKGMGRLSCTFAGYAPCHNETEILAACTYDAERDLANPTGSVFCAHGAGFVVSWDQVPAYMHLAAMSGLAEHDREAAKESRSDRTDAQKDVVSGGSMGGRSRDYWKGEKELEEIFARTYGSAKRNHPVPSKRVISAAKETARSVQKKRREAKEAYLLVDGYNIIFAWEELKSLAQASIDGARDRLKDILCNYQGWKQCTVILVFDAYRVEGHREEIEAYHNIHVVFTKEAETADQYIEKTVHALGRKYEVTVATSDGLEQVIILGQGGRRLSAQGLKEEIALAGRQMQEAYGTPQAGGRYFLEDCLPKEAKQIQKERLEERNADSK